MTKNYVCCTPYLSKHTSFDCVFLLHTFKMMTFPQMLFSIFQNLGFLGLGCWGGGGGGVKRGKMAQNDKKFVSLCLSGTVPHMIVVFGTHV